MLDMAYLFGDGVAPTTREVVGHARLTIDVDLSHRSPLTWMV